MTEAQKTPPGPLFIALSGKQQAGKDTFVNMAVEILRTSNKPVAVTAFAEPLKRIAIDVLGIPRELVYGSNEDKEQYTHIVWDSFPDQIRRKYGNQSPWHLRIGHMTVREVLQVLGTDIFREMLENDVWAKAPFRREWPNAEIVFITDARFPNEVQVVKDRGGVVIRLERDTGLADQHISETALDDFDFEYCYQNNGSLDELRDYVRNILRSLKLI